MPSPFPGMNPYLEGEKVWPAFQHQLVNCIYQTLLPNLVDRYRSRVAARDYQTEEALFTSVLKIDHREHFMEIRNRADDKLITSIEIVSPANRCTAIGRQQMLTQRAATHAARANTVLIDLVMQGKSPLDLPRQGQPEYDYCICVSRAPTPDRIEIYHATLQKRLPRFKIPLANDDRDTIVDLQMCFTRCFDLGNFGAKIDYSKDPPVALTDEQKTWLDATLKAEGVRQ